MSVLQLPVRCSRSDQTQSLLQGEILVSTQPHNHRGAAVTAQMYLSQPQERVWSQITQYDQWSRYFEAITTSSVLSSRDFPRRQARIHQTAHKNFLVFQAEVEIYLTATEFERGEHQVIEFRQDLSPHPASAPQGPISSQPSSHFHDFSAQLSLQPYQAGCLLTYGVQATPTVPIPVMLMQQAMQLDLPTNMRQLRSQLV
jgi:hypothetical protein